MKITEHDDGTATIELERYGDLLVARTLSEWQFAVEDPPTVTTRVEHLAAAGIIASPDAVAVAPYPDYLFDYQRWILDRCLERERFAVFADCGLGKTAIQLEWARQILTMTGGRVLIVAPLQVVGQTVDEASHWYGGDLPIVELREQADVVAFLDAPPPAGGMIGVTNYEKVDALDTDRPLPVDGVVLDESSILKQSMGARRTSLMGAFAGTRWKLCCTATPAPNDRVEYAQHALFLDVVRSSREFLARFFINRDGEWQLKHHGEEAFYRHLASWSVFMRSPAAYAFVDNAQPLPAVTVRYPHVPLTIEQSELARDYEAGSQPSLFGATPGGIVSRTKVMQIAHGFLLDGKGNIATRVPSSKPERIAEIANVEHGDEQVIVWVTFDEEARQLGDLIPDAVVLSGKTPKPKRRAIIDAFRRNERICECRSAKNSGRTTGAGPKNTVTTSVLTVGPTPPRSMHASESSTQPIPPCSSDTERRLRDGKPTIPKAGSHSGSSPTASRQTSTAASLRGKTVVAPSAAVARQVATRDSTSTIATPPGESADSSVAHATRASASSTTTQDDLSEPRCTCGNKGRVLIVKPQQCGFGLNLQACRVQVFSTITDSFERFYQAVRRSHRYGQTRPVIVYIPLTSLDEAMCQNVLAKELVWREDGARQEQAYVDVLRPRDDTERRVYVTEPQAELDRLESDQFTLIHGDSIAHMETMPDECVDLAIFSPPFANLFTYSSDLADMGNTRSDGEYRLQWRWFAERLARVMRPGRNVAIHAMDIIRFAGQHGVRHTYDYPSDLRAGMQDAGFLYRARIAIDKNPQIQATRTKDANLLFVTLTRNALDSHPQACEYVLLFTAPGDPETAVVAEDVSNKEWIEWAHHVWYGIRETDVLNAELGREHEDERHICPLQLPLIERCVRLWSARGETVFSPFAGIGSEGVVSLEWGRRFYGVELKRSYFDAAARMLGEKEAQVAGRLDFIGAEADVVDTAAL